MNGLDIALPLLAAPAALGEAIAPGWRWVGLLHRQDGAELVVEGELGTVRLALGLVSTGRAFAVRGEMLTLSYRPEGAGSPELHRAAFALCERLAGPLRERESAILAAVRAEESATLVNGSDGLRLIRRKTILEPRDGSEPCYIVNPYEGCLIGCTYCYAQASLAERRALHGLRERPWGSYVEVVENAAELLAAEIAIAPPRPIKFAAILTDPYHAPERRQGITRQCLVALREARCGWPVMVLSRARLMERDLPLLAELPQALVGVSLPCDDDARLRELEPRAASAAERLGLLASARALGLRTFAVVQPLLPCEVTSLADKLAAVADSVRLAPLEGGYGAESFLHQQSYAVWMSPEGQLERLGELAGLLRARGVEVWTGEYPAEVARWAGHEPIRAQV